MKKIYFTFGSDPKFPYGRDDYIVILGTSKKDCTNVFKKRYPNKQDPDCLNCSEYYSESEWTKIQAEGYYKNEEPKEIIVSDTVYGHKPGDYEPIWFAVPSKNTIVFLQEGSGDNLDRNDRKNGYVDYLDFASFELGHCYVNESNGGIRLLKEYTWNKYMCLADAIPDVLDSLYDDPYLDAQIINMEGE